MKIGIIAYPQVGGDIQYPTNYVHWVRLSGAVPIVIPYHIPSIQLHKIMNDVDGLVFTGGDIESSKYSKSQYTTYLRTIQKCIQKAKEYNDNGVYYPLWGICLGFELLILLEEADDISTLFQNVEVREHYSSSSLQFTSARSTLTSYFTAAEIRRFKKTQCVIHRHTYSFKKKEYPFLITTAVDHGYISMFEFKDYPFYGCQFHVEHPFNDASTYISYKLSLFLKEECSKN